MYQAPSIRHHMGMKLPALVLAALLAGCSAPAVAAPTPPPSVPSSATPSPSVTPTQPAGTLKLGETLALNGGDVTVQVQKAERWTSRDRPAAFRVMVRTCNVSVKEGIALSWLPWVLAGDDGSEYPASDVTMTDDPKPLYPFMGDRAYKVGQCARGWVMFDVAKRDGISAVRYANTVGDAAEWAVPA